MYPNGNHAFTALINSKRKKNKTYSVNSKVIARKHTSNHNSNRTRTCLIHEVSTNNLEIEDDVIEMKQRIKENQKLETTTGLENKHIVSYPFNKRKHKKSKYAQNQIDLNKTGENQKQMSRILVDQILQPSSSKEIGYLSMMSSAHNQYDKGFTFDHVPKTPGGISEPSRSVDNKSQSSQYKYYLKVNNTILDIRQKCRSAIQHSRRKDKRMLRKFKGLKRTIQKNKNMAESRGGRAKRNRHMDMVEEVGWAGIVHNI